MAIKKTIRKSNVILGKNIERLRLMKNMSITQLGRKINKNKQQILKYECGNDLVPLTVLEDISNALDDRIAKRIIRKISLVRKLEVENDTDMTDELIDLYHQALPEDI